MTVQACDNNPCPLQFTERTEARLKEIKPYQNLCALNNMCQCGDGGQMVTISIFCWTTGTYLLETLGGNAIILHLPTDVCACHPGAWFNLKSMKIMQQPQKPQRSQQ